MSESGKDGKAETGLEPLLQAHIGKKLREIYEQTAREPVPDRFKNLLDQLEAGEQSVCSTARTDEAGPA